jgi:hypothetical protein
MKKFSPGLQIRVYRFRYDLENLFKDQEKKTATPSAKPKKSINPQQKTTPSPSTSPKTL